MATKTLTPSACPVTGNNPAGMPTLAPSADVCSSGGGGGTDFVVAGPIRADGNYDATVGDGSTVDSFALVGARDGNTIVKQDGAAYAGSPQSDANWHIDGVGVADTAVYVGVTTPTIADTTLEAQSSVGPSAFFRSSTDSNTNPTVIIRRNGSLRLSPEFEIQDEDGNYVVRAQARGVVFKVRQHASDTDVLFDVERSGGTVLFGVSAFGAIYALDAAALDGNAVMGVSILSGGTVTVSTTNVASDSRIFLTYATGFTNAGTLKVGTIVAATSFVINSSNASDANHVNWFILNRG